MRIPVYRSQLSPTSEAPGRSISARMSPQAAAQSEMAKAAPASALIQNVGAYAKMRYNAEQELLLNEGLLEAEEGIRQAAYDLERSRRLSDVFGGEKLWKSQTDDLRTQVLDKIGTNRFTRQKFMARFDQMELTSRFQLKDVVDRKIEAAAQASFAARQELAVKELSQVGLGNTSKMIELYEAQVNKIVADGATGVNQGRYSAEGMAKVTNAMRVDIAKNVVGAYVSTTPSYALGLAEALEVQDLLAAGVDVAAEDRPELPGGAYALHTLQNIPREEALGILNAALTDAAAFQKLRDDAEKDAEEANERFLKSQSAEVDELMLTIDPLKFYMADEAREGTRFVLGEDFEFATTAAGDVTGKEILKQLRIWAFNNTDVTEEKNSFYLERINSADARPKTSNPIMMEILMEKEALGTLTLDDVDQYTAFLTVADQRSFFLAVRTQGDRGVGLAKTNIRQALRYDANTIANMDEDAAKKLTNEVNNVYRQLDNEVEARKAAGKPMNEREIVALGNQLLSAAPGIRDILNEEYDSAISDATTANTFPDIISGVSSLPYDQRPAEIVRRLDELTQQPNVAENIIQASKSFRLDMLELKKRYEGLTR
jgi:hypothetical protein